MKYVLAFLALCTASSPATVSRRSTITLKDGKLDIYVVNMDIASVAGDIAELTGRQVSVTGGLKGNVNLNEREIDPEIALQKALREVDAVYRQDHDMITIYRKIAEQPDFPAWKFVERRYSVEAREGIVVQLIVDQADPRRVLADICDLAELKLEIKGNLEPEVTLYETPTSNEALFAKVAKLANASFRKNGKVVTITALR
ncbi:hypothetical protein BH11ARM1_BH11ARM1_17940 [soil metagenome]